MQRIPASTAKIHLPSRCALRVYYSEIQILRKKTAKARTMQKFRHARPVYSYGQRRAELASTRNPTPVDFLFGTTTPSEIWTLRHRFDAPNINYFMQK